MKKEEPESNVKASKSFDVMFFELDCIYLYVIYTRIATGRFSRPITLRTMWLYIIAISQSHCQRETLGQGHICQPQKLVFNTIIPFIGSIDEKWQRSRTAPSGTSRPNDE